MAGNLLTTASVLNCPHGGMVSIISANTLVLAGGAPIALATDTFPIAGCPFQIPVGAGMVPSPCIRVQWIVTDMRNGITGSPTLSTSSIGICLSPAQVPQGLVVISATQPTISSL